MYHLKFTVLVAQLVLTLEGVLLHFFMPSEMKMLMQLHEAKIPVKVIKVCCLLQ
jgi:hypothetical protein